MKVINVLNRIVIVLLCLGLMFAVTVVFVSPSTTLTSAGQWALDWGTYLANNRTWLTRGVGVAIAIAADIILLLIIYLEVRRRRSRFIRVLQVAGGMATVSTASVSELLQNRLDPQPGVVKVDPHIRARGNRVAAQVDVGVARGTNVPEAANQLIKTIQTVLTDEMGLQLAGQPEVRVSVVGQKGGENKPTPVRPTTTTSQSSQAVPPRPFSPGTMRSDESNKDENDDNETEKEREKHDNA